MRPAREAPQSAALAAILARARRLGVAFAIVCAAEVGLGSEVEVLLRGHQPDPAIITVNRGDTVTWRLTWPGRDAGLAGLAGEWQSPILSGEGAAFSRTFDLAGTFAYQARLYAGTNAFSDPGYGLALVAPWTNSPPAVTLNAPAEGFYYLWTYGHSEPILLVASATNSSTPLERIEFLSETTLLGEARQPPYRLSVTNLEPGPHVLVARAIAKDGQARASATVRITVDPSLAPRLTMPRLLPGGLFVFNRTASTFLFRVMTSDQVGEGLRWLRPASGALLGPSGVFVDTVSTNTRQRYFRLERN